MTTNGQAALAGGVLLGGREMRVRLDRVTTQILGGLAKRYGVSPTTMAEKLLHDAVHKTALDAITMHVIEVVRTAFACGRWK